MTEHSNWEQRIQALVEGHEPNVPSGWAELEQALDVRNPAGQMEKRRQRLRAKKNRARWLAGAGFVVMLGLGWWGKSIYLDFTAFDAENEIVVGGASLSTSAPDVPFKGNGADLSAQDGHLGAQGGSGTLLQDSKDEGAARTSNEWVLRPGGLVALEGSNKKNAATAQDESNLGGNGGGILPSKSENSESVLGFKSSVQEACQGTEVSFSMDGNMAKGSFLWNFGDGTFSNDPAPTHVFERPGTYDITISIRSHNDGMIRTRTVENMIVVRPIPDAQLSWNLPESTGSDKVSVELLNETERASSAVWIVDDKRVDRSALELAVPGVYDVHLIASNAYGCQDDARGMLKLGDRVAASAPAVFSPNGDGRYDTFLPGLVTSLPGSWSFVVLDEQGKKVFECQSAQRPWDGSIPSVGKASPGQSFRWTLSGVDRKGQRIWFSDVVKIER
jgi:PKD repeat protein